MKFFTKLATSVVKGVAILAGFNPYISTLNPKAGAILGAIEAKAQDSVTLIGKVLADIHTAGISANLTNKQKLDSATPLVAKIIRESEAFAGHEIMDGKVDAFMTEMQGVTTHLYEAFQLLKTDNIKTA